MTSEAVDKPEESAQSGISGGVTHGITQTREAMKWLIVAFGAVATTLVAGSQLSELGALDAWSDRWWTAVAGLSGALLGVLAAILGGLWIMLPTRSTLSDAASDPGFTSWVDDRPELLPPGETSVERFRRTYFHARSQYDQAMDAYERADAAGPVNDDVTERQRVAEARWAETEPWAEIVNDARTDYRFRAAAKAGFFAIFLGGAIVAVGVSAFAWAAHPEAKKPTTAAEAPAAPTRVRLVLTDAGTKVLSEASGCDLKPSQAVQIGGTSAAPELLIVSDQPCKTVRLTLSESLGAAVRAG
jgi:hypothetical protein